MSTTAVRTAPKTRTQPHRSESGPSLGALTRVELRKMTDTRAGFWLQLGVAAITVAAVIIRVLSGPATDHTLQEMLVVAVQPAAIMLPIVGILLVSSEWSQRTALSTFALVPQRSRVVWAKLGAAGVLAAGAMAFAVVLSVAGAAAGGAPDPWTLSGAVLGQSTVYVVSAMLMGVGFGALFLNSPAAIVGSFVIPTGVSALAQISAIHDVFRWIDQNTNVGALGDTAALTGTEWARTATTLAVWMLIPIVVGAWRIGRAEIR